MGLADITGASVEAALAEFNELGRRTFLTKHGFSDAKRYWLVRSGKRYPSKAIAGVAHSYLPNGGLLPSASFTGGESSVVRKLRSLGFEVERAERNPPWSRDELILALDLYRTNPASPPGKGTGPVATLSDLLNKMHRLTGAAASDTFRNANGVYMKMMNLRAIDPAYIAQGKVGMTSGGQYDKEVWTAYEGRWDALAKDAAAIRETVQNADEGALAALPAVEPYEGEEGGVIMRLHKRYERDRKLVVEKRQAAALAGAVACEVCGFDFKAAYGDLGAGYIEVHHTKPVHMLTPGAKTKLTDLVLLCANCHRMAHRKRLPLSVAELRIAISSPLKTPS